MKISLLILYAILFLVFLVWNIVVLVRNHNMLSNQILIPAIVLLIFGVFTGIAMLLAMISVLTLLPKLILTYKPFGEEVNNFS